MIGSEDTKGELSVSVSVSALENEASCSVASVLTSRGVTGACVLGITKIHKKFDFLLNI